MIGIKIEDGEVRGLLNRISGRLGNMSPVMRAISGIMHDAVEENFHQGGRPRWEPSQRVKKYGGQTLIDTAQLVGSIEPGHNKDAAWASTNKKYAAIHQFGGDITHPARQRKLFFKKYQRGAKRGKSLFTKESKASMGMKVLTGAYKIHIEARPFMKLTAGDLEKIKGKMGSYLVDGTV